LVTSIGVTSYALAAAAYLIFTILLLTGWRGRLQGGLLVLATGFTVLWAATLVAWSGWGVPGDALVQMMETLHLLAWLVFMLGILRYAQGGKTDSRGRMRSLAMFVYGLSLVLLVVPFVTGWLLQAEQSTEIGFFGYLLLTVSGLFLVENLYRNTRSEQRWGIKFLCLGIGSLFAYDFFMYAQALLFKELDMTLWSARGAIYALVAPLIGISVARNPQWSVSVFISRKLVLHTATLVAAGSYLLLMAAAGYFIKTYGGEWGTAIQIVFLFGAGVVLLALLFSGQLRARIRVFLGKHFFHQRYDYREQWLNFTDALSLCKQEALPHECVVRAIADVVDSPGGFLWLRRKDGSLEQVSHWGVSGGESEVIAADSDLVQYFEQRAWVVNLDEYRADPETYLPLDLPGWVIDLPRGWLLVPLLDQGQLLGIMVITQPRAREPFNWELRDLLKTAATQAASHLAQLEAVEALAEARQFEGFHRLSAFVLHDIKNLIAQQSLLVGTAAQHKHKPEFIDDAIEIMEHSVAKMQRLMQLMRTGISSGKQVSTNLVAAVSEAVNNCSGGSPVPVFNCGMEEVRVTMDRDRMTSVIENLLRNAQDATAADGMVTIGLECRDNSVDILIEDNGCGMDAAFVRERLFRPFDTTKGDTGMGIGAYECREYVHSLGGEIQVDSEPGKGTRMHITLPLSAGQPSRERVYTHTESVG
jgi:putative PEP-CTERM system histidine kinase